MYKHDAKRSLSMALSLNFTVLKHSEITALPANTPRKPTQVTSEPSPETCLSSVGQNPPKMVWGKMANCFVFKIAQIVKFF